MNSNGNRTQQPETHPKDNPSLSPRTRNRIRVEEMYRLHGQLKANRRNVSEDVETASPGSFSYRQKYDQLQPHHQGNQYLGPLNAQTSKDSRLLQTLVKEVNELKKMVTKRDRRFVESERRLTRLEVTVNKTFIVLGDVSNAINTRMLLGSTLPTEIKLPKGFHKPKLPLNTPKELYYINKDLSNQDFFKYLVGQFLHLFPSLDHRLKNCLFRCHQVNKEKEFCCSSEATDTATMTSYLRRFICTDVRASLVLKELKGQKGKTLYCDYYNVYLFLVETMKSGYLIKNKILTNKDVHVVLRTVWGRSKQTAAEERRYH